MRIGMTLESDTIFGNGISDPAGADIGIQTDVQGFPYYKGSTFKGLFRETMEEYLSWIGIEGASAKAEMDRMLGSSGSDADAPEKLSFSDFCLPENVRAIVWGETIQTLEKEGITREREETAAEMVRAAVTNRRVFISISENGMAQKGSLRSADCINKGLTFYGEIACSEKDRNRILEILSAIKWVGTLRNRGFGKVKLFLAEEDM